MLPSTPTVDATLLPDSLIKNGRRVIPYATSGVNAGIRTYDEPSKRTANSSVVVLASTGVAWDHHTSSCMRPSCCRLVFTMLER
jgi:hypothetical protein